MKTWLITGVSSGIGEALARSALDRGDLVIGTARTDEALASFAALGQDRAFPLKLDVASHGDVPGAVARAFDVGPIDVIVSNAGRSLFGAFEEASLQEVKALFDVNVFGTWALAQAALPYLRAQGSGMLVHLSSGSGINGTPGLSAYSASKFAVEGFTEALAQEVARFGVRTMLVEPGAIRTRFISHGTDEAALRLPEYGFLSGAGRDAINAYYESAALSAETAAQTIIAAIDSPEPPFRLLIGEHMRSAVARKAAILTNLAAT